MTTTVTQARDARQSGAMSDVPDPEVPERARRRTCCQSSRCGSRPVTYSTTPGGAPRCGPHDVERADWHNDEPT